MLNKELQVCLLILACSLAAQIQNVYADTNETETQDYQQAYNLILSENWEKALAAFESFTEKYKESSYLDDAHFWHCFAKEKTGIDNEEVFKCYQNLIEKYPKSKWADDAKRNMIAIGKKLADTGKSEYGEIVRAMQESENNEIALSAIRALGNMDDEVAMEALLNLYGQSLNVKIRKEIIFALSEIGSPRALEKLTEIAKTDTDSNLRKDAIFWFGQKADSEDSIKFLEDIALNDSKKEVREKAVFALSEARDGRGAGPLRNIVQNAKDVDTRKRAIFWLGQKARTDETIKFLQETIIKDVNNVVSKDAVFALAEAPDDRGLEALATVSRTSKNPDVRKEAVFWLGQKAKSDETIQYLKSVALDDPEKQVRKRAVFALSEAPEGRGLEALQEVAKTSEDHETRKEAVFWLGQKARTEQIISFLETIVLEDSESEVRERAILGLSEAPEGRGLEALKRIAKNSSNVTTRKRAIFWLTQKAKTAEDLKPIETVIFENSDPDVRQDALNSLAQTSNDLGIPILIRVAKTHPDMSMRKKAIFWLGQSKDPNAQQAILDIVNNMN